MRGELITRRVNTCQDLGDTGSRPFWSSGWTAAGCSDEHDHEYGGFDLQVHGFLKPAESVLGKKTPCYTQNMGAKGRGRRIDSSVYIDCH